MIGWEGHVKEYSGAGLLDWGVRHTIRFLSAKQARAGIIRGRGFGLSFLLTWPSASKATQRCSAVGPVGFGKYEGSG